MAVRFRHKCFHIAVVEIDSCYYVVHVYSESESIRYIRCFDDLKKAANVYKALIS